MLAQTTKPFLSEYPGLPQHFVRTCVIMEAFAKSVNAGGCDYLSKLPWCFKLACITQSARVGGRYEKPDGTYCFLKSCYCVTEGCCGGNWNRGFSSGPLTWFTSRLLLLKKQAVRQSSEEEKHGRKKGSEEKGSEEGRDG